jgi:diacylglycerol kinase family enzyme
MAPTGALIPQLIALLVVLGLAVLGVTVALRRRGSRFSEAAPALPGRGPDQPPLPAVVANPTKIAHLDGELAWLAQRTAELGWQRPLWLETTPDEPGTAAARQAVAAGARTVIAYGGDGTVRGVAAGLEGTGATLGILPMGTGNLLARNLGLPLADLNRAVEVALTGREQRIDLGIVEIDVSGEDEVPARDVFLVMAGLGFDAEVMASVQPELKQRVGWLAYVVAGARRLRGRTTAVTMRLDDGEPVKRRVRSVIVGNCGELTGGVLLMPMALVDDGWLDVVVVAPRRLVQWGTVLVTVLSRARPRTARARERRSATEPVRTTGHNPIMEHFRCRSLEIRAEKPLAIQLDGDPACEARVLRARVDHLGLTVRTL